MSSNKFHRFAAAPLLVLGLGAPALSSGCGDNGLECDPNLVAKVEAFQGALDALVRVSGEMKGTVAVTCMNLANDLGASDVPTVDAETVSDDELQNVCDIAQAELAAQLDAAGSVSIAISGGKCEVAADVQASCEASCSAEGQCDPGGVEARCDPGELSGTCTAECSGSCTVESGSVECEGACEGTCSGSCTGECSAMNNQGECEGICEGECMGTCEGTCEVVPPSATCEGTCTGGCSVDYEAPKCTAELDPPDCDIDAECEGGCEAQGELEAECSPPQVVVDIEGDADLAATLETHLPDLILVAEVQGEMFVESAAYVAETGVAVVDAALSQTACAAQFAGSLAADFEAAASASASVNVSFQASASVSGEATAGGG